MSQVSVPLCGLYFAQVPGRHGAAIELPSPLQKKPAGAGLGSEVPLGQKKPAGQRPVPNGVVDASLQ